MNLACDRIQAEYSPSCRGQPPALQCSTHDFVLHCHAGRFLQSANRAITNIHDDLRSPARTGSSPEGRVAACSCEPVPVWLPPCVASNCAKVANAVFEYSCTYLGTAVSYQSNQKITRRRYPDRCKPQVLDPIIRIIESRRKSSKSIHPK